MCWLVFAPWHPGDTAMQIRLVIPTPPASYSGNQATADRWAHILGRLGHRVQIAHPDSPWSEPPPDVVIALHARKSEPAVWAARQHRPPVPVVLALTGTDLYPDLDSAGVNQQVLQAAAALVVLQARGLDQLPAQIRNRAYVIYQSATTMQRPGPDAGAGRWTRSGHFDVAMLAHLRPVKDPGVVWRAVRLLPNSSRVMVWHAGTQLDSDLASTAREQTATNPRYTWLGELSHDAALELLASCRLLVHPSVHEGGANVVSEALTAGIPIVATRIPGTEGILGPDYPGYFPTGDARSLADLLTHAENDPAYLSALQCAGAGGHDLVTADQEEHAWQQLLADLRRPVREPSR